MLQWLLKLINLNWDLLAQIFQNKAWLLSVHNTYNRVPILAHYRDLFQSIQYCTSSTREGVQGLHIWHQALQSHGNNENNWRLTRFPILRSSRWSLPWWWVFVKSNRTSHGMKHRRSHRQYRRSERNGDRLTERKVEIVFSEPGFVRTNKISKPGHVVCMISAPPQFSIFPSWYSLTSVKIRWPVWHHLNQYLSTTSCPSPPAQLSEFQDVLPIAQETHVPDWLHLHQLCCAMSDLQTLSTAWISLCNLWPSESTAVASWTAQTDPEIVTDSCTQSLNIVYNSGDAWCCH